MIHSSARAHGVLTKASSLPREHTLLSMPDSLSACQGMKKTKHMDPAGGLAPCVEAITAVSCRNGKQQHRQAAACNAMQSAVAAEDRVDSY